MRFTLPANINNSGLTKFLSDLSNAGDEDPIAIDFQYLGHIDTAALVGLCTMVNAWRKQHRSIEFLNLTKCRILSYLQRIDLLTCCNVALPESFIRHSAKGRFVPIKLIDHEVEKLGSNIALCIAPGGDDYEGELAGVYDMVWYVFTEIANNVRQHSGGQGYTSAQVKNMQGLVNLAIADNGQGIRESFIQAGFPEAKNQNDQEAIEAALRPRVSSKSNETNEGVGLTLTCKLAELTGAWLTIISGSGYATLKPGTQFAFSTLPSGGRYPGTLISLTFRQERVKDFPDLMHSAKIHSGLLPGSQTLGKFSP